jgi:hypothetical protein
MRKIIKSISEEVSGFFRMLLLKDYLTNENCREAIISSIEKGKNEVDRFTIHAECKIRYFQIMAFWLFLPFVVLFLPVLILLNYFLFLNKHHLYFTNSIILLTEVIVFIGFYITFFRSALLSFKVLSKVEQQLIHEDYNEKNETKKGQILLILLHELIKNESNQPNWFYILSDVSDELKKPLEALYNIRLKNLTNEKNERFKSFNSIKIATEGQRTTHLNYMKQLMTIYRLTNDDTLLANAQKLQNYIERTPLSK